MSQPFLLFHVSDLHFGYEDRKALDWFAQEVADVQPDGVICTGDLTMRGTAREFAAARKWLEGLGVPTLVEPGNHDMPYYYNPLGRLLRPYRHYEALRLAVSQDLDFAEVEVVSLRTISRAQLRLNQSKGKVKQSALDRALARLAQHAEKPLRLVACHHPLVEADTHATASTRGGKRALAALARAGADAVLSGHVHDAFDKTVEIDGYAIRMIGAGTLSERVRTTAPSYNRLSWSSQTGLAVEPRSLS
ncbi:metallophosphoesterase [Novosphingobium sp. TH158]|uniref:metallophosphoesterase family protein n=1 Tax=Novosphingobium sp. TH158 TaxID=2067455 RepID=UPI000C7B64C1|nr:metallophosphoesterase [Novosphingobium sp. TH158]PLK27238.1 metallophosphoesterase [Novosphingobium sp. TH158]